MSPGQRIRPFYIIAQKIGINNNALKINTNNEQFYEILVNARNRALGVPTVPRPRSPLCTTCSVEATVKPLTISGGFSRVSCAGLHRKLCNSGGRLPSCRRPARRAATPTGGPEARAIERFIAVLEGGGWPTSPSGRLLADPASPAEAGFAKEAALAAIARQPMASGRNRPGFRLIPAQRSRATAPSNPDARRRRARSSARSWPARRG
jgi:hypothetical protein